MLPVTHGLRSSSCDFSTLSNYPATVNWSSHLRLLAWIIHYAICVKVKEEDPTFQCNLPYEEKGLSWREKKE